MKNINNFSSEYYDELSKEYKSVCNSRRKYLESINSIISKYINLIEPKELLDIGTADGSRLRSILSKIDTQINCDCLEPSQKMFLLCCKNKLKDNSFKYFNTTVEDFYTTKQYDLILALWNILGHAEDPKKFLTKIINLMGGGSYLILDVNNSMNIKQYGIINVLKNLLNYVFNKKNKKIYTLNKNKVKANVQIFSSIEVERIIKSCNYKIEKKYFIDYETGQQTNFLSGQLLLVLKKYY